MVGKHSGWDKPILELGVMPFLLAEIFKITLLTVLTKGFLNYEKLFEDLLERFFEEFSNHFNLLAVSETFLLHNSKTL